MLHSNAAQACSPAPSHWVEILTDDSPECLTISWEQNFAGGAIAVNNQCAESVSIVSTSCDACSEDIDVAPGTVGRYGVETRPLGEQLPDGTVTNATIIWSMSAQFGVIEVTTTIYDRSDACSQVCSVRDGHSPSPVWLIGCGLALLSTRRRRAVR